MSSKDFQRPIRSLVVCFLAIFTLGTSYAHAQATHSTSSGQASTGSGQAYPAKTIEWISHTSAGSGTDLFNRNVSVILEKEKILNVPFIHTNRVGGNGLIA